MLDNTANATASLPQQDVAHITSAPTPSGCRHGHTWHVAATKPRSEHIAHAALHHRGYTPYLPTVFGGRPLFPGYVFLQLGPGQPWYPIQWAPGVYNLLSTAGKPSIVDRGVISALQAGDEARATRIPDMAPIAVHDAVRLASGPMKGQHAVVINLNHKQRATIAIINASALFTVSVKVSHLEHQISS